MLKINIYLYILLNNVPTKCTIGVDSLFANSFPNAFPPTVKEATTALIINCKFVPVFSAIFAAIIALIAPLSTPHISPITSAHILATFAEFFINFIEVFAPSTFLVAFAWNSSSFATVTATPIISKIIPTAITTTNIIIDETKFKLDTPFVDIYENIIDNTNVVINNQNGQNDPNVSVNDNVPRSYVPTLDLNSPLPYHNPLEDSNQPKNYQVAQDMLNKANQTITDLDKYIANGYRD